MRINYLMFSLMFVLVGNVKTQDIEMNLQAYYKFNNNLEDESVNQITGLGFELVDGEGIEGMAYVFNGENSYIDLGTDSRSVTNKVSISAWIKTVDDKREFVISKYNSNEDKGYFLGVNEGIVFLGGRDGSTDFWNIEGTSVINDGEWHHIVGVYSNNEWFVWVDCVLENSVVTNTVNPDFNCSDPLTIGNWYQGNTDSEHRFFSGTIDEVRLYNRVLSDEEIAMVCDEEMLSGNVEISKKTIFNISADPNPSNELFNINIDNNKSYDLLKYRLTDVRC